MAIVVRSVVPIWVLAALGVLVIAVLAPLGYLLWVPVLMTLLVLSSLVVQTSLRRKDGYVERLTASVVGAFVILALATGVLGAISFAGGLN